MGLPFVSPSRCFPEPPLGATSTMDDKKISPPPSPPTQQIEHSHHQHHDRQYRDTHSPIASSDASPGASSPCTCSHRPWGPCVPLRSSTATTSPRSTRTRAERGSGRCPVTVTTHPPGSSARIRRLS